MVFGSVHSTKQYSIYKLSVLLLHLLVSGTCVIAYEIADVMAQALDPRGLSVSIPDSPGITSVEFSGIAHGATYEAEQSNASHDRWTILVPDLVLNDGDVVDYRVYVTLNHDDTYLRDGLRYTVREKEKVTLRPLPPPSTTSTPQTTKQYYIPPFTTPPPVTTPPTTTTQCPQSVTTVKGQGNFCVGEVIFEDDFNNLDEDKWQIEHKIPSDHPEYPFVTYLQSQVQVARFNCEGYLLIEPKVLNWTLITEGIDLGKNCTGRLEECHFKASGADIVRPIASGRISTKNFTFKYGRVDVRAMLPQGDWLYPELLLEEFSPWSQYNGIMKIACVRGNKYLQNRSGIEFGKELLYGMLSYSPQCQTRAFREVTKRVSPLQGQTWPEDFHTYSLMWAPTGITFLVDGQVIGSEQTPPFQGDTACGARKQSTTMSPFDRDYKLSFGVAAGGIGVFEDELKTIPAGFRLRNKPWRNKERKAMLNFIKAQKYWLPTWEDSSALYINYVRVTAL